MSQHFCVYCFLGSDLDRIYSPDRTKQEAIFYVNLLNNYICGDKKKSIVEFGAGTGRLLGKINECCDFKDISYVAMEVCPKLYSIGRQNLEQARWINIDVSNIASKCRKRKTQERSLSIPDIATLEPVDAVLLSQGILLHLPDGELPPPFEDKANKARQIIESARNLLAPKGIIVADVVRYDNGRPMRKGIIERQGALRFRFETDSQQVLGESEFLNGLERVRYWRILDHDFSRPWVSPWAYRCTPTPDEIITWFEMSGLRVLNKYRGYDNSDDGRFIIVAQL